MEKTGIIWTEHTVNFMRARHFETKKPGWFCTKVNEGCRYCYAETLNMKFGNGLEYEAPNLKLIEWYMAQQNQPAKLYKKFGPALIFINSMTDTFHKDMPEKFIHEVLDIVEKHPYHEFQSLTKRPDLMYKFSLKRPLPQNFWAGITIPDEKARTSEQINYLKKTKASIHWISCEPIIGEIFFTEEDLTGIDQIITGGESGSHLWNGKVCEERALVRYHKSAGEAKGEWKLREDRIQWLRNIRDLCQITGTKFFHKQHGGSYPEAAGRTLDGRTWNEIPRYPGGKDHIDNAYLKHIEKKIGNDYGAQKLF